MTKSELIALVGVVATILAVAVALFKEEIQRLWRKPVLDVSVKTQQPDCHVSMTTYTDSKTGIVMAEGNCYYLRLWVHNDGNLPATNVQVFANKLRRETTSKKLTKVGNFLPMNLRWAHTKEIFRVRIDPKMGHHCDLGHIANPRLKHIHNETRPDVPQDNTILFLDLEVVPLTLFHLLQSGYYELELIIAADNRPPIKKVLKIMHNGNWYDEEKDMFEKGVKLEIIK